MTNPKKPNLPLSRLFELLTYHPDSGEFIWRLRHGYARTTRTFNTRFAGKIAGAKTFHPNGYPHDIQINIDGKWHKAHRLAWLWMTGEWPSAYIDHINHNSHDNRWINLRLATKKENGQHRRGPQCRNSSGVLGVHWHDLTQKWRAQIKVKGKSIYIGLFKNKNEAAAAYRNAAKKHFGKFAGG